MPGRRRRLTKSEEAEFHRIAERMRAAGADIDPSTFRTTATPWICLKCCRTASSVSAMPAACVFVVYLRIVALAPKVVLQEFDLTSPDWPLNAVILGDPGGSNSANEFYRLLDRTRYHRNEVVNHRLDEEGILRRGDILEGLLLAYSLDPVPAKYPNWGLMRLCVSITNQFDGVQELAIELPVEHIPAPVHPRTAHGSLYEGADASAGKVPGNVTNIVTKGMPNRSGNPETDLVRRVSGPDEKNPS
jgi:hypothetical protein